MFIFFLVDINECTTGSNDCEQDCVNFAGRYNCKCRFGFELNTDRKTCKQGAYFLLDIFYFKLNQIYPLINNITLGYKLKDKIVYYLIKITL